MANIVYKDNKTYYQIYCYKCKSELLFTMTNEVRRVYGACKNCMAPFDVEVPSLENKGCKNCGITLLDCDKYCPNCGWPNIKKELKAKEYEVTKVEIESKPNTNGNLNEKMTPEENRIFRKYLMAPFLLLMSCSLLSIFMMLGGILPLCSIALVVCLTSTIWIAIQKKKLKDWPKIEKFAMIFMVIGICGAIAFLGLVIWGITLIL